MNAPAPKRRLIPQEELAARAAELARPPAAEDDRGTRSGLVLLRLGREWFGVPARLVREVIGAPAVTRVPAVPDFVAGILNLRGELVGVLDPAALLGLKAPEHPPAAAVVVRGAVTAALLATEVADVRWFADAERETVLPTVPAQAAAFLAGVRRDGERLVLELDVEKVLADPRLLALREEAGAAG